MHEKLNKFNLGYSRIPADENHPDTGEKEDRDARICTFRSSCTDLRWAHRGDPPVGQGHAVKQAGQSRVDAQAAGAERPVPVRLAPRPVHRVQVVSKRAAASPAARLRVAVGRRHHEVSAVDDLSAGEGVRGRPGADTPSGLPVRLRVRVWVRGVLELAPSGWTNSAFTRHSAFIQADSASKSELSLQLIPSSSPSSYSSAPVAFRLFNISTNTEVLLSRPLICRLRVTLRDPHRQDEMWKSCYQYPSSGDKALIVRTEGEWSYTLCILLTLIWMLYLIMGSNYFSPSITFPFYSKSLSPFLPLVSLVCLQLLWKVWKVLTPFDVFPMYCF